MPVAFHSTALVPGCRDCRQLLSNPAASARTCPSGKRVQQSQAWVVHADSSSWAKEHRATLRSQGPHTNFVESSALPLDQPTLKG